MQELTEIIRNATSCIEVGYFHLPIDGGDSIYRERVYCYELYHQMRLRWPSETEFCLNGEIDKSAHPILCRRGVTREKPDLLVHRPGHMSGNHAVVEVKSTKANIQGIRKDLEKLALFRNQVGYQRAIYLIYGYQADRQVDRVLSVAGEIECLPDVELWLHQIPGESATLNTVL
jgi:hypothetical protein